MNVVFYWLQQNSENKETNSNTSKQQRGTSEEALHFLGGILDAKLAMSRENSRKKKVLILLLLL